MRRRVSCNQTKKLLLTGEALEMRLARARAADNASGEVVALPAPYRSAAVTLRYHCSMHSHGLCMQL